MCEVDSDEFAFGSNGRGVVKPWEGKERGLMKNVDQMSLN